MLLRIMKFSRGSLENALRELAARPAPPLPSRLSGAEVFRALFVPGIADARSPEGGPTLVTAMDLLSL